MPRKQGERILEAAGEEETGQPPPDLLSTGSNWQPSLRPGSCAIGSPSRADLSLACSRMPRAVICLETAAYMLGLADQPPFQTWFAMPQGSRALREYEERWRVIYWTNVRTFEVGVILDGRAGASIRTTDCARTIVDLVRCQRYLRSLEPAYQAARRYVAAGHNAARLLTIAEELRSPIGTMRNVQVLVDALQGGGWAP